MVKAVSGARKTGSARAVLIDNLLRRVFGGK
jgi:hypothetical protein